MQIFFPPSSIFPLGNPTEPCSSILHNPSMAITEQSKAVDQYEKWVNIHCGFVGHIAVAETIGLLGEDGLWLWMQLVSLWMLVGDFSMGHRLNWVSKICSAEGTERFLSVAGSHRFEILWHEFWIGKTRRLRWLRIAISFSDGRNGGGGVEVGVVLNEPDIKVFFFTSIIGFKMFSSLFCTSQIFIEKLHIWHDVAKYIYRIKTSVIY